MLRDGLGEVMLSVKRAEVVLTRLNELRAPTVGQPEKLIADSDKDRADLDRQCEDEATRQATTSETSAKPSPQASLPHPFEPRGSKIGCSWFAADSSAADRSLHAWCRSTLVDYFDDASVTLIEKVEVKSNALGHRVETEFALGTAHE
jgi:hypothetical protein